ncbi:RING-H2 finger protein ATL56-like [Rutidosis leptorrhynchoides]|uniref:RING-H2 finger protein ATL56-like n=1 Tax=Rutidosis leptorrhynchoides TaxID=125765 RepID=UPI003A9A4F37
MVIVIVASVMILIVGVAIFVVIHVCIVGRTFGSQNRRALVHRNNNDDDNLMINTSGSMSQDDIKKLPSYDYNLEEQKTMEMSLIECVVCLEKFKTGERCKLLPNCNHIFHGECIDSWLIKTGACPICRAFVDMEPGESSFSSELGLESV